MTTVELTIKNYRCFPDDHPLRLTIAPGFTSFVGINNAGKSSILRLFWECAPLLQNVMVGSGNVLNALNGNPQSLGVRHGPGEELPSKLNDRDITLTFEWRAEHNGGQAALAVTVTLVRKGLPMLLSLSVNGQRAESDFRFEDGGIYTNLGLVDVSPLFEACRFLGQGMYLGPFRNTINERGGSDSYFDISVGEQFVNRFHQFKSGNDPSQNEAVYQLIQDIKRIFGFSELDLNAEPGGKTLQVFIEGRSFRLSELGTGIAQFILVLANVMVRRPSVVFIDEPESNLHPTLQLDFLTTLASYCSDASVFFATHNLGLARAASDRIYSCRRLGLGVSEVKPLEATTHLAEFLGELGFSAYRDLGFDSVLLVEGPTEVKTMQQLLRKWGKDHQMVLLQLGGASMINGASEAELAEIMRISPNVAAVIDSEKATPNAALAADRAAFVNACQKLGIKVLVLERRAIENYFTDEAVKLAMGDAYSALGNYDLLKGVQPSWAKRDNWRIARELEREDIEPTDLGQFINAL